MRKNFIPLIAIFVGLTMILVSISLDGNILSFWSLSSVIITILGSFCALMVSYPFKDLMRLPKIFKQVFIVQIDERADLIILFSDLAKIARREGLLSLEDKVAYMDDDFLKRGLHMVIDGMEPEIIREILELEMESTEGRHKMGQKIIESWSELAPGFGMLGTLIGLIIMLSDLDDPSSIGKGMGTALITTFYGSLFANLILIPMATHLKNKTEEELLFRDMMIEGILAIQAGVNPRVVEEKLMTYLPPKERNFEKEEKDSVMDYE